MTSWRSATQWAGLRGAGTLSPDEVDMRTEPSPRIGVLERNAAVGTRIARVLSCATGLSRVVHAADPGAMRELLGTDPVLLACDAAELDLVVDWVESRYPSARIVTWTATGTKNAVSTAVEHRAIVSVLGWPSFVSMPRPWELSLAARRVTQSASSPPRLAELLDWGATSVKWRPRSSDDRDHVVAEVQRLAELAGANVRTGERLAQVAHELLMNAMYDAPRDEDGRPRYAYDRRQALALDEHEVPVFRMACDGVHIALQCNDPFGALRRGTVFASIERGLSAANASPGEVLDTSGGGAGLGLFRIYAASTSMVVDVSPGSNTSVTSMVALDVNPREARTMPVSLHVFTER